MGVIKKQAVVQLDEDGLPIPQQTTVDLDSDGLPIPPQKKNGGNASSTGLETETKPKTLQEMSAEGNSQTVQQGIAQTQKFNQVQSGFNPTAIHDKAQNLAIQSIKKVQQDNPNTDDPIGQAVSHIQNSNYHPDLTNSQNVASSTAVTHSAVQNQAAVNVIQNAFQNGDQAKYAIQKAIQKQTGINFTDLDQVPLEQIQASLPKNLTNQVALQKYTDLRNVNDALAQSGGDLEKAAIHYAQTSGGITLRNDIKALQDAGNGTDMLIGDGLKGQIVYSLLQNPDMQYLASKKPELLQQYREALYNMPSKYPDYAAKLLISKIAKVYDEKNLGHHIFDAPDAQRVDPIVDDLIKKGELPPQYRDVYNNLVRPRLGTWNRLIGNNPVPTADLASNIAEGVNNSISGFEKTGGLMSPVGAAPEQIQLATSLNNQAVTPEFEPSRMVDKLVYHGGQMAGYILPIALTGNEIGAATAIKSPEFVNQLLFGLNVAGDTHERALQLFPDNPLKQGLYTSLITAANIFGSKLLPGQQIPKLMGEFEPDVISVLKDATEEKLTAAAAKQTLLDKFTDRIGAFAKNATTGAVHGGEFMGAVNGFDNALTQLLQHGNVDMQQTGQAAWESFKQGLIATAPISAFESALKHNPGLKETIYDMSQSDPAQFKSQLDEQAKVDKGIDQQKDDIIDNFNFIHRLRNHLDTETDLSDKQKKDYIITSLLQKVKEKKAAGINDDVLRERADAEINDLRKQKSDILNTQTGIKPEGQDQNIPEGVQSEPTENVNQEQSEPIDNSKPTENATQQSDEQQQEGNQQGGVSEHQGTVPQREETAPNEADNSNSGISSPQQEEVTNSQTDKTNTNGENEQIQGNGKMGGQQSRQENGQEVRGEQREGQESGRQNGVQTDEEKVNVSRETKSFKEKLKDFFSEPEVSPEEKSGGTQPESGKESAAYAPEDLGDNTKRVSLDELGIKEGMTIPEVLDKLIEHNGPLTDMLKFMRGVKGLDNVKFRFADEQQRAENPHEQGKYFFDNSLNSEANRGTVQINEQNYRNAYTVLAHELSHWFTIDSNIAKYADKSKLRALKSIFQAVKTSLDKTGQYDSTTYGLKDFPEFLAELLTNANFRDKISELEAKNPEEFRKAIRYGAKEVMRGMPEQQARQYARDLGNKSFIDVVKDFVRDIINKIFNGSDYNKEINFDKSLKDNAVKLATDIFFGGKDVIDGEATKSEPIPLDTAGTQSEAAMPSGTKLNPEKFQQLVSMIKSEMLDGTPEAEIRDGLAEHLTNAELESVMNEVQSYQVTSLKNAKTDEELQKYGFPPILKEARQENSVLWDKAMKMIDDGYDPQNLVALINEDKPRPVSPEVEQAMLLYEKTRAKAALEKAKADIIKAKQSGNEAEMISALSAEAKASDEFYAASEASKKTGTEWGRAGRMRQLFSKGDYSLTNMENSYRSAKGGEPLTEQEKQKVAQLHAQIEEAQKKYESYVSESNDKIRKLEKEIEKLKRQRPTRPSKSASESIKQNRERLLNKIVDVANKSNNIKPEDRVSLADKLRGLADKIDKSSEGMTFATPISPKLLSAGLRIVAEAIEKGEQLASAIKKAYEHIKGEDKNADQQEFEKYISDQLGIPHPSSSLIELKKPLKDMMKGYVLEGKDNVEEIVDAIHKDLSDKGLNFDKRDIRDALSGYGEVSKLSKEQIDVQLRDLRAQMRLISAYEDASKGQRPLKSGFQRDEPSDEVKKLRQQVTDEMRKQGLMDETTDEDKYRTALQAYKKRVANNIKGLEEKIEKGDFEKKKRTPLQLDAEAAELKKKYENAKFRFEDEIEKRRRANRSKLFKALDWTAEWGRAVKLSSIVTLGKLASAAAERQFLFSPVEHGLGGVMSWIPGLRKIALKAPRFGGFNTEAEAKSFAEFFSKAAFKESFDVLKGNRSQLEAEYGHSKPISQSWMDLIGHFHAALKNPVKRAEFERSLAKRTAWAIKNGMDPADPIVASTMATEAYKDAKRSIFMQDNLMDAAYRRILGPLEKSNNKKVKAFTTVLRVLFPVVKIPVNFVGETTSYAGGALKAMPELIDAIRNGLDNISPEDADYIMRNLTKQTVGVGLMALGYMMTNAIGGYYTGKRKDDDLKAGDVVLFGVHLPHWVLHAPGIEVLQVGATLRRVHDSYEQKGSDSPFQEGMLAASKGIIHQIPFIDVPSRVSEGTSTIQKGKVYAGGIVKGIIIPPDLERVAKYMDPATAENIQRKPKTFLEAIEVGIPGLRQNVETTLEKLMQQRKKKAEDRQAKQDKEATMSNEELNQMLEEQQKKQDEQDAKEQQLKNLTEKLNIPYYPK